MRKKKITFGYTKCANDLTALKKEKEFLKEVDSISLQQSLRHLDTAFQNFFKNSKTGFPKFKSKKNHNNRYTTVCVNNNIILIIILRKERLFVMNDNNKKVDSVMQAVDYSRLMAVKEKELFNRKAGVYGVVKGNAASQNDVNDSYTVIDDYTFDT